MSITKCGFRVTALALAIAGMFGATSATAGDKLTDKNMSRADYIGITATESSVKDEPPTAPPQPVHDLTDGQVRDMAAVGGAKVINAKDWKNETLAERDAHLRRIKETLPAGASLILTVPKGEVWVVPARADDPGLSPEVKAALTRLLRSIRNWTEAQILALPWDVMRGDPISQSDKRGSNGEQGAAPEEP